MSHRSGERFFVLLPWDFYEAWLVDRRIKPTHVLTALYVAARCFEARNTSGGVASVELQTIARLCGVGTEMIRRRLHDLRDWGWLDFKVGDGGDPAWQIWLTGLSREEPSPRALHDLSTETPPLSWRGLSTNPPSDLSTDSSETGSANPHDERERPASTSPPRVPARSPLVEENVPDRRDETRPEKNYVREQTETTRARETSEHEPADWRRLYEELITEGVDKREARVIAHALADDEAGKALLDDDEAPGA